jgi:carbonic anhydrase
LFITCADSRIDPELITQSGPGGIFVSRNVGNLVPTYSELPGGVSAIIEYAVLGLRVSQIVVCGHTDCGAMIGLLHPEKVALLPIVKSWLHHGDGALSIVRNRNTAPDEQSALRELIEENVLLQLQHLRTHPSVADSLARGSLALSGWVYDIGLGVVHVYSEDHDVFLPVIA